MKIQDKRIREKKFKDMGVGDTFMLDNDLYMMVYCSKETNCYMLLVKTGKIILIDDKMNENKIGLMVECEININQGNER